MRDEPWRLIVDRRSWTLRSEVQRARALGDIVVSTHLELHGREPMAASSYETIQRNPKYQQLVAERSSLGRALSIAMIVIYFGFILLVAFAPGFLGASLTGGVTTVGIVVGLLVIVAAFLLTAFYVIRANGTYDALTQDIVREASK